MAQVTEESTRRTFLKTVGAVGAGTIVAAAAPFVNAKDDAGAKAGPVIRMPKRPLEKRGWMSPYWASAAF